MSAPLIYFGNGPDCTGGCGCDCTPSSRCVGGAYSGGDGLIANMLTWIEDYDITTVPWNTTLLGNFTASGQTGPASTNTTTGAGLGGSINNLVQFDPGPTAPCTRVSASLPTAFRGQIMIPCPTPFYIVAWGTCNSAALGCNCDDHVPPIGPTASMGCIYPQQVDGDYPMLVDIPIPDNTLDTEVLVQYYYVGIITPTPGVYNLITPGHGLYAMQSDLSGLNNTNSGMAAFGPSWNPSAVCTSTISPSTVDPFTGIYEAP